MVELEFQVPTTFGKLPIDRCEMLPLFQHLMLTMDVILVWWLMLDELYMQIPLPRPTTTLQLLEEKNTSIFAFNRGMERKA